MPIDRFHTDCYNAVEDRLLEYVTAVADRIAPDFAFTPDGNACATDSQAPFMFRRRYNRGKLNAGFSYGAYIRRSGADESLIGMIEGMGIDPEKFWYLLLFVSDYVVGSTFNTLKIVNSPKQDIENFIEFVESNQAGYDSVYGVRHKEPMTLTLNIKGRNLKIHNSGALSMMACFCKEALSAIHPESRLNSMSCEGGAFKSETIAIWLFAKLFQLFFDLYPQFKGQKKSNGEASRSTWLLISRLVYFAGFTKNEDYNSDAENLKAIVRQHRDYTLDTVNSIYG